MTAQRIKLNFAHGGGYRFLHYDTMTVDGEFVRFDLAGETQLVAVVANVSYWEMAHDPPDSSRDVDRGGDFSVRCPP